MARAVLNVFECWADPALFDARLDFAVREWARRSSKVRQDVQEADDARLDALIRMFSRHGCAEPEAVVRARTLYFTQIGYFALDVRETTSARLALLETYVEVFSGATPDPRQVQEFKDWLSGLARPPKAQAGSSSPRGCGAAGAGDQ